MSFYCVSGDIVNYPEATSSPTRIVSHLRDIVMTKDGLSVGGVVFTNAALTRYADLTEDDKSVLAFVDDIARRQLDINRRASVGEDGMSLREVRAFAVEAQQLLKVWIKLSASITDGDAITVTEQLCETAQALPVVHNAINVVARHRHYSLR